jgi:hypothetical protein
MVYYACNIVSFVVTKRDEITFRETRTREIKTEESDVIWQYYFQSVKSIESTTTVSMKIDYTWKSTSRSLVFCRFEMTTMKFVASVIENGEVIPLKSSGSYAEGFRTQLLFLIDATRRSNDEIHQLCITTLDEIHEER